MKPEPTEKEIKAGEVLAAAIAKDKRQQAEIAVLANITAKQIQNYQKGYFPKHNMKSVEKLDEILGTRISEILSEKEVPRETISELIEDKPNTTITPKAWENLSESVLKLSNSVETGQNNISRILTMIEKPNSDASQETYTDEVIDLWIERLGKKWEGKTVPTQIEFVTYARKVLAKIHFGENKQTNPKVSTAKPPALKESQVDDPA